MEIVELIDKEVEDARQDEQGEGWNYWGVLLAIASLAWVLLGALESKPDLVISGRLLLGGIFGFRAFRGLYGLIEGGRDVEGPNRYRLAAGFGVLRPELMLRLCLDGLMIWTIIALRHDVPATAVIGGLVIGLCGVLMMLSLLVITFTKLPIPEHANESTRRAVIVLLFGAAFLNSVVAIQFFWNQASLASFPHQEVRLAGAAFGLYLLLPLLARSRRRRPLIEELRQLRRDIMLGQMDVETAREKAEILLLGLRGSDLIQSEIRALQSHLETAHDHLGELKSGVRVYNEMINAARVMPDRSMRGTHFEKIRALHQQLLRNNERLLQLHKVNEKLARGLADRASAILLLDPGADTGINAATKILFDKVNEMRDDISRTVEELGIADLSLQEFEAVSVSSAPPSI